MADHYASDEEILAVVAGFENSTTSREEFTHLSHLTVATYYLCNSTPDDALEMMRFGLLRFLDHHGVNQAKYNQQVTREWLKLIWEVIELKPNLPLLALTNTVLVRLGTSPIAADNDEPS